ncbi:MAG: archaeal proteasome endopeptidase complex subunit alpha, partial [Methanothrix sp.]|nr:archaeal proteasome endopeptidase complex subunit alpha [Methanothrix sp.]
KAVDGVVVLVDKRITSRLMEPKSIEKIFQIDSHIGAATSGLVADARVLIDRARVESQINRLVYDEPIGVEALAKKICDFKQQYTQYGGVRPFGTALLIVGAEEDRTRLFETDPSGALLEYKATGIGAGRAAVMETFEEKYKEDLKMDDAVLLGLEALYKASEGKVDAATTEIGIIKLADKKFYKLTEREVAEYVDRMKAIVESSKGEKGEA